MPETDALVDINADHESEKESIYGFVSDCSRLNIREEADVTSDVVVSVIAGSSLMIDPECSTDEWYKVYTQTGAEGYCMREYVEVAK